MRTKLLFNKLTAWLIVLTMLTTLIPTFTLSAFASSSSSIEVGDFTISPTDGTTVLTEGTDYSYASKKLTLTTSTPVTVGMKDGISTTDNTIEINTSNGLNTITLSDITIETSGSYAVYVSGGNLCTFNVIGKNTVKNTYNFGYAFYGSSAPLAFTSDTAGTLNIESVQSSIYTYALGAITIGGNVEITAQASTATYGTGVICTEVEDKGMITIHENAVLNIPVGSRGIENLGNENSEVVIKDNAKFTMSGATSAGIYNDKGHTIISGKAKIDITGDGTGLAGIFSKQSITVSENADIDLNNTGSFGMKANKSSVAISDNANVFVDTVSGSCIYADTKMNISNNAEVTVKNAVNFGVTGSSDGFQISDNVIFTATNVDTGINGGGGENTVVSITGSPTITVDGNSESGIKYNGNVGADFTISGKPTINVVSSGYGCGIGFGKSNSIISLDADSSAILIACSGGSSNDGLSAAADGTHKIEGNTKIVISGASEYGIYRNFTIQGNAAIDITATVERGVYGNITVAENGKVTISEATERGVYGNAIIKDSAEFTINQAGEEGIDGNLTVQDSATATITAIGSDKVLSKDPVIKPLEDKAYLVKTGASASDATDKYYTEETTIKKSNAWRYFHASPADVSPVTITNVDKTITYDGSKYDVSEMFLVDSNAGAATYSIVEETGNGIGSGTLSGNELTITKAGKIKIKIETAANGTYLSGEATAILTVNKGVASQVSFPTASSITYGGTLENSALTGGIGNGAFTWKDNDIIPTVTNNGYIVVFTPNDAELYDYSNIELETTVAISVSPLPINITWNSPKSLVYDGTDKTIVAEVANKVGNDSLNLTIDGTTTAKDKGDYVASVTGVDNENYTLENGQNLTINWSVSETVNTFTTALDITGWIYGDTPNEPTSISAYGTPEYTYSDSIDGVYSTTVPTDAGTYYVKATVVGTTNYPETSNIKEFVISEKELTADNITSIADTIYTGEEIKPVIEIKDGNVPLVLDTDYTVEYQNNVNITGETKAKAVITFIGNYKGTAEKEFVITPKTINSVIPLTAPVKNAVPQTSIETDEYTATVVWTPEVTSNFAYSTVYTATVTITPKSNYTLTGIAENGYTFNGAETVINAADTGAVTVTYPATGGRSSGGGGSVSSNTSTTTTKNEDGSTTKTTTNKSTGTKTEVTTHPDGSTTKVETKKDGTTVKTETNADGETTAEVEAKGETEVVIPAPNADEVTKVIVTDKDGNETEVEFEVKDGGIAISVSGNSTVSVQTGHICYAKDFTDVDLNSWYHLNIDYVLENGLFKGTNETTFAPNDNLTRAMLVTVLYRAEGEPATNRSIPFADVDMGSYYANAVIWAQQNGIVKGVSETEFAPNDNITREQIAAILYRYAIYKGMDAVNLSENLSFTDANEISEYAISALNWAVGTGLIKGYEDNTVRPLNNATRAEAAALLERFIEAN